MKQTFNIPEGCKVVTVEQIGNQLITSFEPEKYVPKVGDFVKAVDSCTAIFEVSRISDGYLHLENVSITDGYINTYGNKFSITKKGKFQKITPEEFQAEFDKLGYVYDFEAHTASKKRSRAEKGEEYFFFSNLLEVHTDIDIYASLDDKRYNVGNYFKTKEDAEAKVNEIKKLLKQ